MSRDMVHSVNDILAIAEDQKMPLEQMRFFINRDYKEPKAFGIFQNPETLECYFQDGSWYWFDDIDLDWEPYYGVEDESEWFDDYYYGTDW